MDDDFFLTNLELRDSTETGEQAEGLSHSSMKGMFLLAVLELAARGEPIGAVTVVHDAGDTGARYKELATRLAEAGWAVALPDLRGHGQTEGERGHSAGMKEVVRDLDEIQNHLAYRMPDEPKVLVGQGLGALYALHFALERPGTLAGLVLSGPLLEPGFHEPEAPKGLKKLFQKVTPQSPGSTGYTAEALTSDPEQAAAWSADATTHDVITLRAIEEARSAKSAWSRIGEVGVPVLVLQGDADEVTSVAAARELAGADVRVFDGMRHHPLQEKGRGKVLDAVVEWMTGVVRPSSS
ncbi:MAG: alpha/beta hydrolase [bacterium]|nr:alpha/beta hydrolase [bacterium]